MVAAAARGKPFISPALYEADSRFALKHVNCRAVQRDGGYVLDGGKSLVPGEHAQAFLVSALIDADAAREDSVAIPVPADSPGIEARHYATLDGGCALQLRFNQVALVDASRLDAAADALPIITHCMDLATIDSCAYQLGAMAALLRLTIDYLKTRRQLGGHR